MSHGITIGVPVGRVAVKAPPAPATVCLLGPLARPPGRLCEPSVAPGVCPTIGVPPKAFSGVLGASTIKLFVVQLISLGLVAQRPPLNLAPPTSSNQVCRLF